MLTRILCILQHIKQQPKGAFIKLKIAFLFFAGFFEREGGLFCVFGIRRANSRLAPALHSPAPMPPRRRRTAQGGRPRVSSWRESRPAKCRTAAGRAGAAGNVAQRETIRGKALFCAVHSQRTLLPLIRSISTLNATK
nr:MAG TPA: hypothetical protein [Bacteriophage sp.]